MRWWQRLRREVSWKFMAITNLPRRARWLRASMSAFVLKKIEAEDGSTVWKLGVEGYQKHGKFIEVKGGQI